MKKFFLIPLMALMCSVMAFADNVAKIGTTEYATLKAAVDAAQNGDEILLLDDYDFGIVDYTQIINIKKSVTLNGQGHTLTGACQRQSGNSNYATIWVNLNGSDLIDVTFKNITIINSKQNNTYYNKGIETRGRLGDVVLDNVTITSVGASLQIGGDHRVQQNITNVTLTNCHLNSVKDGKVAYYPMLTYNTINLTMTNCETLGWSALYFKYADGSTGSYGTNVVATNCTFDAQNYNAGATNDFGAFVLEDDGINIELDNCIVNATTHTEQDQAVFCLSTWKYAKMPDGMHLAPCEFTVRGASTEIIGNILTNKWDGTAAECPITFFFYGGTYDDNIEAKIAGGVPSGFHVNALPTVKGGEDITLYRVVKDAEEKAPGVLYDLNDDVPTDVAGAGNNPATSFDLSTGTEMELNQATTNAGYVQVSDNGDDATVIKVGKVENAGTPSETKVDQKLVIGEGLDVQGESQVIVQAGSTLQIGEGGITTEDPENIVIEADESGAASLLLNPEVIVNNTPNLTVRMTAKQIGRDENGDFYWHRFALPVAAGFASWEKEGNLVAEDPLYTVQYPTYLYAWDYVNNAWDNIAPNEMNPIQGYTLTLASDYIHVNGAGKVVSEGTEGGNLNALQDVTYIFKGNLVGNTDQALTFKAEGFNFFGNSYTGYMDVKSMLQGLASENVDGTVYMWCNDPANIEQYQTYVGTSLHKILSGKGLKNWQKEVAPMQTFILRLRGADSAEESVNYATAIWGNPRYGNNSGSGSGAPRRRIADINEDTYMEIAVKAANGKGDVMDFTESASNNDAFESGYDVEKYMNKKTINLYATVNGTNFSSVVTNNLIGKTLSLQTNDEINYTMSFSNVDGNEYAIRDNVTNQVIAIEEGVTYEFAAQPNSVIEGRFEIVSRANMPTAIENTEVKANVKGIYTIMGQYLGENFDILPAGVYVVNGVKIVK